MLRTNSSEFECLRTSPPLASLSHGRSSSTRSFGASTILARFATKLRRDFDAINASLTLPWTTSRVEGQISRLKMLKRTMYGRAGFQLLRARAMNAT